MGSWLTQISSWLPGGVPFYLLLSLTCMLESLPLAGLIVPGSSIAVLCGLLAFQGQGTLPLIMISAIIGACAGDSFSFWLGLRSGPKLLRMRSMRRYRKLIRLASIFFIDHGGKSLFFARFIGPIRGITPFIAGLSQMRPAAFILYTTVSALLWGISYPGIGYLGGRSWQHAQTMGARFALVILALLLIIAGHQLSRRFFHKLSDNNNHQKR
jgi:undecaprenyl-diphosphatase